MPSLETYDISDIDSYHMGSNRRVFPPDMRGGPKLPDSELKTMHCGGCWCGETYGHDWPGKDEGAPHPR